MTDLPLRIGVSSNFLHADPERAIFKGKTLQFVEERMALSLYRAGAVPLPLPDLKDDRGAAAVLSHVHGLVLSGGADVSPTSYGETPLRPNWAGDPIRDAYERRLVNVAIDRGIPVLGLCRGIQILNVALGGSLWQDIETQVEGSLVHRDWHRYDETGHEIRVEAGSWLSTIYGGATSLHVNSVHHQAARRIADALKPTAWASDEIVEALEWVDDRHFVVGLQWHPEWLEPDQTGPGGAQAGRADGSVVFEGFMQACRERQA